MNADSHDVDRIAQRLMQATKKLSELAPLVGSAKAVKSYDSDRKRSLLAVEVFEGLQGWRFYLRRGRTSRQGIRSLPEWLGMVKTRTRGFSERTIAEFEAEQAAWDTARSLLAVQRESLRQLHG